MGTLDSRFLMSGMTLCPPPFPVMPASPSLSFPQVLAGIQSFPKVQPGVMSLRQGEHDR